MNGAPTSNPDSDAVSRRGDALALTQDCFVFDCLSNEYVLDERYAQACLEAGVNATDVTFAAELDWDGTLKLWEKYLAKIDQSSLLQLALNSTDIERAHAAGKLAAPKALR